MMTRPVTDNRYQRATAALPVSLMDTLSAVMGEDTLTDLLGRQGEIQRADTSGYRSGTNTKTAPDVLNQRYSDIGLNFDSPMTDEAAEIVAEGRRAQIIRDDIIARGPGGLAVVPKFGAALLATALDPLEVASAFIPVVGPARMAGLTARFGRIGGRAIAGAVEGTVGNALLEPAYFGLSRQQQLDYGMSDALLNIGLGGVLGGVLGAGVGAFARRVLDAEELASRDIDRAVTRAEREQVDGVPLVTEPPFRALTRQEKFVALKSSVAQMAQGRAVNVGAVIPPLPKKPKSLLDTLRDIGLRDYEGDLRSMGLRDYDVSARFRKNIVRADGMPQDLAARQLWEMGYFRDAPEAPEMLGAEQGLNPEPDLVPVLQDAIDRELRGEPVYSAGQEAAGREYAEAIAARELSERRNSTREALAEIGVTDPTDQELDFVEFQMARGADVGDAFEQAAIQTIDELDAVNERLHYEGAAQRLAEEANNPASDPLADFDASREIDDYLRRDVDFDDDIQNYEAMAADLDRAGLLGEADKAALMEADAMLAKADAAGDVARAYAACLAR